MGVGASHSHSQPSSLLRCCCCRWATQPETTIYTQTCGVPTHKAGCHCSPPPRSFIAPLDDSGAGSRFRSPPPPRIVGMGWESVESQRNQAEWNASHPQPYDPHPSTSPNRMGNGNGHHRRRWSHDGVDDDSEEFDLDLDSSQDGWDMDEPAARNLTEQQIQKLIQQQVARLNARLNELDEELAQEEAECERQQEETTSLHNSSLTHDSTQSILPLPIVSSSASPTSVSSPRSSALPPAASPNATATNSSSHPREPAKQQDNDDDDDSDEHVDLDLDDQVEAELATSTSTSHGQTRI